MKIFVLCAIGVAVYILGFNFGYVKGYGQGKKDEATEWQERQMQAIRRHYLKRSE